MNNRPSQRTISSAAIAFAVLGTLIGVGGPAPTSLAASEVVGVPPEAEYVCGSGWRSAAEGPMPNVSLFVYCPNTGPGNHDDLHVVIVDIEAVGQYTRDAWNPNDLYGYVGSPTDPNPEFLKAPVGWHLDAYEPEGVQMVINGTFFECTERCHPFQSELSFPTWRATALANAGHNVVANRRCLAFGPDYEAPPGYSPPGMRTFPWTNSSTTWAGVSGDSWQCGTGSPVYHRVVGVDPYEDLDPQNPFNARTYVGGQPLYRNLCFLVGGYMTVQTAVDILESFGCTSHGSVQMDGGNSSQLAFIDPVSGGHEYPVNGVDLPYRAVPHYFVIWGD